MESQTIEAYKKLLEESRAVLMEMREVAKELKAESEWVTATEAASLISETEGVVRDKARRGMITSRQRDGRSKEYNKRSLLIYMRNKTSNTKN